MNWQPINTAPKDRDVLVWYDHDADPYQDTDIPYKLTDYGTWTERGDFLDGKGICIAKWHDRYWEPVDEYDAGYWLPAAWFAAENDDYARVVNPTHWMPLPEAPK